MNDDKIIKGVLKGFGQLGVETVEKAKERLQTEGLIADYFANKGARVIELDTSKLTVEECVEKIFAELWDNQLFKQTVFAL